MKLKLIIFLSISILLAVVGGSYLLIMSERRIADFDYLIMLHEVEILRTQLLLSVRTVDGTSIRNDLAFRQVLMRSSDM